MRLGVVLISLDDLVWDNQLVPCVYLDKQQQNHQKHIYINVLQEVNIQAMVFLLLLLVCVDIPPLPPTSVHSRKVCLLKLVSTLQ